MFLKVEERDPWLLFSLKTQERTFDFYGHNREDMDKIMGWVHALGRLITERQDNQSGGKGGGGGGSKGPLQHKSGGYLAAARHYRSQMMWRKLIEKMDIPDFVL